MIIVLLNIVCFGENEKLKDLELYEFRSGGVVGEGYGGIDYILNAKNSKEILLYFKIYSSEKEIGDFKFTESRLYLGEKELEDKKLALSDIFDKNNLDSYYSRDYTELKNGKKLWLVFVGALNVGKMKFCFDERIQTNAMANFTQIYEYENLHIKKGERLGNFELGSTIVILSEKDAIEYNLFENKELKFAEAIGRIREI